MHDSIFLCQSKYAKNLIKKFAKENTKHIRTPIGSSEKLCKDDVAESGDNTLYRNIIGSLLYLTASRPDIMFSICLCARYQSNPKISHLKVVKRILRYIAETIDLGLWYTQETNTNLVGFSDADWVGDLDDRKCTTIGCFYLGNNLVSWYSRKQNCVSLSTVESEYVAARRQNYDPLDIRSEMGHREDVAPAPAPATSVETLTAPSLQIIHVAETPILLETISPDESGNELNV
ncbi:secreted RxLR effector protein 161-like [Primulina huaijiensis]|uniref:secreted RxLR effector protein 161-like n=1 Tax=Primulina huaijiensis TaxID=1492673 RepID=UPI003CC72064